MSDDLVLATKAVEELEPAVQAFAEATGALGPVREFAAWATDLIRYRRAPHQARLLMRAAEKIKASGLPPSAIEDKLLRAVLEDGPMEDDEQMQERWANLLANAGTTDAGTIKIAFPKILSELEPAEASLLDTLANRTSDEAFRITKFTPQECREWGADQANLDNLNRVGLIHYVRTMPTTVGSISDEGATIIAVRFTELGWAFVQACRPPRGAD
jgi:hypothetical protein